MSKRSLVPTLKQHPNGTAYCKWRGRFYYFGTWEKPDTDRFQVFLKNSMAGDDGQCRSVPVTIMNVIKAFIADKELQYTARKDIDNLKKYRFRWKQAFRPLLERYGGIAVTDFGPKAFKAVRKELASNGRSRTYVNDLAAEIRFALQWGVGEEMVPETIYRAIKEVKVLRPGEMEGMPEGREVQPVPLETVHNTLPFLAPPVAAIVQLLTMTVSRPGEIAKISADQIDKNGPDGKWVYWLSKHKLTWRGKKRFLVFGKEAQEVLLAWWKPRGPFFLNDRTSKSYTSEQLRKAIEWACKRAGIPYWHPYQIRHTSYSSTSLKHGTEAAALLAGHSSTRMAERYDHSKVEKAARYAG